MSSITVYIYFNKLDKEDLIYSLESGKEGSIIDVSDILNVVTYRTSHRSLKRIKIFKGVIRITNTKGERIER